MLPWIVFAFVVFGLALLGLSHVNSFRLHEGFQAAEDMNNNRFWFKDWKDETFTNMVPTGVKEREQLSPADAFSTSSEKLLSPLLQPLSTEAAEAAWDKTTSQVCYQTDQGEVLKKTRNFLQRTNNYPRTYPDSCSAPNHELIGTFYEPSRGAIGRAPKAGTDYPPSTQCGSH